MHNGVALQGGTPHYFGDGFAKSFGITYTGKDNKLHYPHQTSWGVSTRMIGALIMVHSDDDGLVLPPKISPIQVALIPVAQHKEGVLEKAEELRKALAEKFRVKLDSSDHAPGWKFAEYEMKGVPVRVEMVLRISKRTSAWLSAVIPVKRHLFQLTSLYRLLKPYGYNPQRYV